MTRSRTRRTTDSMSKVHIDYEKLPYQDEFHEATETYDILSAGYGAGKTYSLCMKALRLGKCV